MIGKYPAGRSEKETLANLKYLYSKNILCFVDLTCEGELTTMGNELLPYQSLLKSSSRYKRLTINDQSSPSREKMVEILDYIDSSIKQAFPIYLHCRGGKYRTGTVVGCYLARHGIANGENALLVEEKIRTQTHADEFSLTESQKSLILSWNEGE